VTAEPSQVADWFAPAVIAARVQEALDDPEGEAAAVHPLRPPSVHELAAAWDAEIDSTPLPDVDVEYPVPEGRGTDARGSTRGSRPQGPAIYVPGRVAGRVVEGEGSELVRTRVVEVRPSLIRP
jgi:hypothetical protein